MKNISLLCLFLVLAVSAVAFGNIENNTGPPPACCILFESNCATIPAMNSINQTAVNSAINSKVNRTNFAEQVIFRNNSTGSGEVIKSVKNKTHIMIPTSTIIEKSEYFTLLPTTTIGKSIFSEQLQFRHSVKCEGVLLKCPINLTEGVDIRANSSSNNTG